MLMHSFTCTGPLLLRDDVRDMQADADKAASDKKIAETGQKPMKTEAPPQI